VFDVDGAAKAEHIAFPSTVSRQCHEEVASGCTITWETTATSGWTIEFHLRGEKRFVGEQYFCCIERPCKEKPNIRFGQYAKCSLRMLLLVPSCCPHCSLLLRWTARVFRLLPVPSTNFHRQLTYFQACFRTRLCPSM
jgi:hypothetical protein